MEYDHKEYPKLVGPKDYWAQVKRTVNGRPVSESDIDMIIMAIRSGLNFGLDGADYLLDLGCGNGALTSRLYKYVRKSLGVDFSEYLIDIAKRDFLIPGTHEYVLSEAHAFVLTEPSPCRFNKALIYGCFAYFHDGAELLADIRNRFKNMERVFIGNLPDLNKVDMFYQKNIEIPVDLKDPESKVGIWRSDDEFRQLARKSGWVANFSRMPSEFYASHYRFDVVLTPL